jgi:hypothetical protein
MSMRDYSLSELPVPLAVEGDELVVQRLAGGSAELVRLSDLQSGEPVRRWVYGPSLWDRAMRSVQRCPPQFQRVPAIYVPPGADVILKNIPVDLRQRFGIEEEEGAKLASAEPHADPDAVEFHNECRLPLRDLPDGMRLELLSLATAFRRKEQCSEGPVDPEQLALQTAVSGLCSAIRRCVGKCKWKTRKVNTTEPRNDKSSASYRS